MGNDKDENIISDDFRFIDLETPNLRCRLCDYGATVTHLWTKDRQGVGAIYHEIPVTFSWI